MSNPHNINQHSTVPSQIAQALRRNAFIIMGITLGLVCLVIWYGFTLSKNVKSIEAQWTAFNRNAATATFVLGRIEANFGYGGFIHNFKNYVLHRDPKLVPVIKNNLQATYKAIEDYPYIASHKATQATVREALASIRLVVDNYARSFEKAQKLVADGSSPEEIDQSVQVNDEPALEVITSLKNLVISIRHTQEQQTNIQLDHTLQIINRGVPFIPLLLLTGALFLYLLRKIVRTNEIIQSTSQNMRDIFNATPDAIFIINRCGEIEEINQTAVRLLGYSENELVGKPIEVLIPERYRGHHVGLRDSAFEKGHSRPLDYETDLFALTRSGCEIPVEISLSYTRRTGDVHVIATLRDITERKEAQDKLRRNEDVLKKAQQIGNFGSWEWGVASKSLTWSDETFRIFGFRPKQFEPSYDTLIECLHPDDKDMLVKAINETIEQNTPYDLEHRIVRPDGSIRIVHQRGESFRNTSGDAIYMVGTIRDITNEKQAENEMRLADNVFSHSSEAILVTDTENNILRINDAFTQITGYSNEEALGKNPKDLLSSGRHNALFYKAFWRKLLETGNWQGEIIDRRKNGEIFPAYHNISTVKNNKAEVIQYISIFSDITEKKRATEHIQQLAQYDQLTELPNRMLFNDRLQQAISRAKRGKSAMVLMFIDLDRFKSVNDTLGHHAGDLLLQEVARRLSSTVRDQDTVARLGGDEFTVILEDMENRDDAANVANKLLSTLQGKMLIDGNELFIGGSIGISVFPEDGTNAEAIVKCADMAMYHAKHQGRNCFKFYTNELSEFAEQRFHMESRLRRAIENDELEVYYQPQIDIANGELVGAEALVRWHDPEKGIISPAEFIPVAEETGLIGPLGDWVMLTACKQAWSWQQQGFAPFRMTVNIAGYQIMQGQIVESTSRVLKNTGLAPKFLELEITEGFVMDHPNKGVSILNELRQLGVSLAIDDFGTGYSSLSYLKRLPIDRLKIDRSFVMDIPQDKDDEAIVSAIIAIAKNLGLTVIAEGVENEEQLHFLCDQACFEVQGFYFSKPVPSAEFSKHFLLTQSNAKKHLTSLYKKGA